MHAVAIHLQTWIFVVVVYGVISEQALTPDCLNRYKAERALTPDCVNRYKAEFKLEIVITS